jgi:O-antigen/teichoic acid export membrane protein
VMSLVRLAGIAILTLVGSLNVYRAVWVFGISDVAASVALLILVNRRFRLRRPLNRDVRRDARPVFRFAFPLWLSSLVRQFRRNIETMLLGALTTVSSVGIFAVAARVNLVGHVTLLALLVAVKPVLAQLHARGDRRSLGAVYTTSTRWAYALNLPFFVVIVLYAEPLLRIFGPSFTAGATALVVFAVSELVNAGTGTCGSLLDMTGHTRTKLANSIIWTVLLIGGGALLIPAWGVLGAAVSTLIAVGSVNGLTVLEVWMLERLQPFDRSFWKPTFAAVAAAIVGLVIRQLVSPGDRFVIAAAQAVLVVVVYIGLVLAIGLAPEDRLVLERTARKLRLPWWRPMVTETTGRRA